LLVYIQIIQYFNVNFEASFEDPSIYVEKHLT
jgi:hypothetical protein